MKCKETIRSEIKLINKLLYFKGNIMKKLFSYLVITLILSCQVLMAQQKHPEKQDSIKKPSKNGLSTQRT